MNDKIGLAFIMATAVAPSIRPFIRTEYKMMVARIVASSRHTAWPNDGVKSNFNGLEMDAIRHNAIMDGEHLESNGKSLLLYCIECRRARFYILSFGCSREFQLVNLITGGGEVLRG